MKCKTDQVFCEECKADKAICFEQ